MILASLAAVLAGFFVALGVHLQAWYLVAFASLYAFFAGWMVREIVGGSH